MLTIHKESADGSLQKAAFASTIEAAHECFTALSDSWKGSKKGRAAKIDGLFLTLLYSDGKPMCIFVVDALPVPVTEPDAQPRRAKGGAK